MDRGLLFELAIHCRQHFDGTAFQNVNSISGFTFLKQPLTFFDLNFFGSSHQTLQLAL